uniref:Secreted protein n=1 Tax=Panagrellus redivivus TaxID=6233 RepID=A0A7E4UXZ8_PANRE
MRLFAIFVVAAVVAVGVALEMQNTTSIYYFNKAFTMRNTLAEYSDYAYALVRNLTTPTPSFDPDHLNYTTLLGFIIIIRPIYVSFVERGLNSMESELRASNHSHFAEMSALINASRVHLLTADIAFGAFLNALIEQYEDLQKGQKEVTSFHLFSDLYKFYDQSHLCLFKWYTVLEEFGTSTKSWLEHLQRRGGVNEVIRKLKHLFF